MSSPALGAGVSNIIGMSDDDRRPASHLVAAILAEAAAGPFTDPLEQMIWESGDFTPEERAEEIVNLRVARRFAVEPSSRLPGELSKGTMKG